MLSAPIIQPHPSQSNIFNEKAIENARRQEAEAKAKKDRERAEMLKRMGPKPILQQPAPEPAPLNPKNVKPRYVG